MTYRVFPRLIRARPSHRNSSIYGEAKFKATADSEGNFKAYVPASDNVWVYATNSEQASFSKMSFAAGESKDNVILMKTADKVSNGDKLSWSNVYFSYDMVKVTSGEFSMDLMTSKGTFEFYLPRESGATLTMNADVMSAGTGKLILQTNPEDVAADHESAVTRALTLKLSDTAISEIAVVNNNIAGIDDSTMLTVGSSTYQLSDWPSKHFDVKNSLSVTLGSSTTATYYSDTYRINPFAPGLAATIELSELVGTTDLADLTYDLVTITGMTSDYTATVYYDDDDYSKYVSVTSSTAKHIKVHEAGDYYTIVIYDSEGTKVYYERAAAGDITKNVTDCVEAVKVTGYIGASITTYVKFTEGVDQTVPVKVSDGTYTVFLKKGTEYNVTLDYTTDVTKYAIDATFTPAENMTKNFLCTSAPDTKVVDLTGPVDTNVVKKVTFTIPANTITNDDESPKVYTFGTGAGWESYTYSIGGKTLSGFELAAGEDSSDIVFVGYYNSSLYKLGTDSLGISIQEDSSTVKWIEFSGYGGVAGQVLINRADDTLTDHAYKYSYEIVNLGSSDVVIDIDLSATAHDGWNVMFEKTNYLGTYLNAATATVTVTPGTTQFSIIMTPVDAQTEVPELKASFAAANIGTATPDSITIEDGKAKSDAAPVTVEVSVTDMSADGRGVVNDKGSVPTIIWVMVAAMAMLLVLIFWMASKRGVFTRRK